MIDWLIGIISSSDWWADTLKFLIPLLTTIAIIWIRLRIIARHTRKRKTKTLATLLKPRPSDLEGRLKQLDEIQAKFDAGEPAIYQHIVEGNERIPGLAWELSELDSANADVYVNFISDWATMHSIFQKFEDTLTKLVEDEAASATLKKTRTILALDIIKVLRERCAALRKSEGILLSDLESYLRTNLVDRIIQKLP